MNASRKVLLGSAALLPALLVADAVRELLPSIASTQEKTISALLIDAAVAATFLTTRAISRKITKADIHLTNLVEGILKGSESVNNHTAHFKNYRRASLISMTSTVLVTMAVFKAGLDLANYEILKRHHAPALEPIPATNHFFQKPTLLVVQR